MAKVTIHEASRRMRISQAVIRDKIRKGELKGYRENNASGTKWYVEIPDSGLEVDPVALLRQQADLITPWWWPTEDKEGYVHYVDGVSPEDVQPHYLCGLQSDNIWDASGHSPEERCPECIEQAQEYGLPL